MSKLIVPSAILNQHLVVLGKTGSGKSSVLRYLVEWLLDHGKRVVITDPKGDWWGLKVGVDGKSPGYPVVLFGDFKNPDATDIPINVTSGKHVGELVATGNRPCVIGFRGWPQGSMTRFWIDFASTLFNSNSGELYLVGDEFHNFAPKGKILDPDAGKCLHWSNRVLSEGRGIGIVCLIASQRPQKVHNDTLTSCESLVAMRVIHKADRQAVKDWIDGCGDGTSGAEILADLAQMKRGMGWTWSPEIGFGPQRVEYPKFRTFDSFAPPQLQIKVTKRGWAETDIEAVKVKLAKEIEQAKANDPAELKRQIAELKQQIAKGATAPRAQAPAGDRERAAIRRDALKPIRSVLRPLHAAIKYAEDATILARDAAQTATSIKTQFEALLNEPAMVPTNPTTAPVQAPRPVLAPHVEGVDGPSRMERKMLIALAQHPDGLSKGQLLIHADYASSGPTSSAFTNMQRQGWIRSEGGLVQITDNGLHALGDFEPLPVGSALREYLIESDRSRLSTMERKMLRVVCAHYPSGIPKGEALAEAGYASSGPTSSAWTKLKRLNYIKVSYGLVYASRKLFD